MCRGLLWIEVHVSWAAVDRGACVVGCCSDSCLWCRLRDGLKYILNISRHGNGHIQAHEPWKLVRGSPEARWAHYAGCCMCVCVLILTGKSSGGACQ